MKCMRCGYQSPAPFTRCPSCGNVQVINQPVAVASPYLTQKPKRSGGESAAIIAAIVVSVLSVFAAFVIFIGFMSYIGSDIISNEEYGVDAFDDFDSNEYDDDIEGFFKDYYDNTNDGTLKSPVGKNTPLKFKEKLYSFSEGEIETEYEVSMTETYRGAAALKLLEGAALPVYNDDMYEIYLVKFKVCITSQEKDAIVTFPMNSPTAYPPDSDSIFSDDYTFIEKLDYRNKYALIKTGDTIETWAAFIIDKEEKSPSILWNQFENKAFRNKSEAISDADSVETGAAIEIKKEVASDEIIDDTSSDGNASSD